MMVLVTYSIGETALFLIANINIFVVIAVPGTLLSIAEERHPLKMEIKMQATLVQLHLARQTTGNDKIQQ